MKFEDLGLMPELLRAVADAGYTARSRARIGDVDVWSIDPATGKTRLVDATPLSGGRPRLAARPDGYMALASVDVENEDRVRAEVAFGWYGKYWSPAGDAGPGELAAAVRHHVHHPEEGAAPVER